MDLPQEAQYKLNTISIELRLEQEKRKEDCTPRKRSYDQSVGVRLSYSGFFGIDCRYVNVRNDALAKVAVFGILERSGRVYTKVISDVSHCHTLANKAEYAFPFN